jgi:hypothetical protein
MSQRPMEAEASSVRASTSRSLHLPPRAQYLPAACICVAAAERLRVGDHLREHARVRVRGLVAVAASKACGT